MFKVSVIYGRHQAPLFSSEFIISGAMQQWHQQGPWGGRLMIILHSLLEPVSQKSFPDLHFGHTFQPDGNGIYIEVFVHKKIVKAVMSLKLVRKVPAGTSLDTFQSLALIVTDRWKAIVHQHRS